MEWFLNYETLATLMTAIGIITVLTNIIVQVVKKATWDKIPTNLRSEERRVGKEC